MVISVARRADGAAGAQSAQQLFLFGHDALAQRQLLARGPRDLRHLADVVDLGLHVDRADHRLAGAAGAIFGRALRCEDRDQVCLPQRVGVLVQRDAAGQLQDRRAGAPVAQARRDLDRLAVATIGLADPVFVAGARVSQIDRMVRDDRERRGHLPRRPRSAQRLFQQALGFRVLGATTNHLSIA
jgi:hypothetical protein